MTAAEAGVAVAILDRPNPLGRRGRRAPSCPGADELRGPP